MHHLHFHQVISPRAGRGKHRTLIPKAELGLHIFQPSPLQSLKEGLYDCVQNGLLDEIQKLKNEPSARNRAVSDK
ncbi:hypothetical protein BV898_17954 [Hypsibius exemplaris]|uniref:Uncharacterized protein n=1 Tax=Hypsibius exemplaris TaxID=2072580 RepID=A0A9X6NIU8_HYPEX|nr:hypothetical protein BV898_17954 [Hypsibius exemplaris]